jgi:hypothetical protein
MTETASMMKMPPMKGSSSSWRMMMATVPMAPPRASDPRRP